jgi:hypothetical protein
MLHKYLFQPLKQASFLGYVFLQYASSKKLLNFNNPPNKKYLFWDNETWSELVPYTYKHTEKIAAIFRDNAI